jgi:hypothetical protein
MITAPATIRVFRLNLPHQTASDGHHHHGDDATWRKHEPGPGGRVAEILLHQLGKELGGADQEGAGRQHHQETGAILAGRQDSEVDHRSAAADLPRDHEHEGERANG